MPAPSQPDTPTARRLTLSFDNGPMPGVTNRVLDELARRGIKATFFVVGMRLEAPGARELAERAKAEGHWIGNHTMHHEMPLGRASGNYAVSEIGDAQAEIGGLSHARRFFRPYAGGGELGPHVLNADAVACLVANKHTVVMWNSVPGDWKLPYEEWRPKALADIAGQDWTLLVLHDIRPELADALPAFLDEVKRMEVEIVQDFPPDCVLMESGRTVGDLSGLVAA